jgi:hypothetical protein
VIGQAHRHRWRSLAGGYSEYYQANVGRDAEDLPPGPPPQQFGKNVSDIARSEPGAVGEYNKVGGANSPKKH